MKLYLSSYRIPSPEDLFKLVGKKPEEIKIAHIPNAKDYYSERAWNIKVQRVVDDFRELGVVNNKVVDLRGKTAGDLRSEFEGCDLIWCMGGNTFMLMEEIKKSGFSEVIKELLDKGVAYGGESAGAIVAGATLRGVEFADEPEFAEEQVWDGMKLIDKIIVPHVGSEMFGQGIDDFKEMHKDSSILVELTDRQAYVVDGNEAKIVTG